MGVQISPTLRAHGLTPNNLHRQVVMGVQISPTLRVGFVLGYRLQRPGLNGSANLPYIAGPSGTPINPSPR